MLMPADLDLLDVRDEEQPALGHARDRELVGRDAAVEEEVRARIDRLWVDSEIPEHRRRGDVELRLAGEQLPGSLRELDRWKDLGIAYGHGGYARFHDLAERKHGCVVELGGDPSSVCGQLADASGRVDRGELPSLGRPEVDPDLSVGKAGRLTRSLGLLGRGDDDDRRRDPERECDGGERGTRAALVTGEVSHRQPWGDREPSGDSGEGADRERAE